MVVVLFVARNGVHGDGSTEGIPEQVQPGRVRALGRGRVCAPGGEGGQDAPEREAEAAGAPTHARTRTVLSLGRLHCERPPAGSERPQRHRRRRTVCVIHHDHFITLLLSPHSKLLAFVSKSFHKRICR